MKIKEFYKRCCFECERLFVIGKNMFFACRLNSKLKTTYEELGRLTSEAIQKGELTWENYKAQHLASNSHEIKENLETVEKTVEKIKTAPVGTKLKKNSEYNHTI